MAVISHLEPQGVFTFFEEICSIPHGSGNVGQISDYLKKFAKDRGLFCIQDETKNIIIKKPGTKGFEDKEPIIIQGHMDMVAVKKPDCDIDMKTEGLNLAIDGDYVYAKGTSLGGDDGIAVAYALAILDSDTLEHPPVEVIITVDEEVGMEGAAAIDLSDIKGHRMLNIDSEDEGIFLVSCAGGSKVCIELDVLRNEADDEDDEETTRLEIVVDGLLGGHSGTEINKGRINSNLLMARLLDEMQRMFSQMCLVSLNGGLADNAIPRRTTAVVEIPKEQEDDYNKYFDMIIKEVHVELSSREPQMQLELCKLNDASEYAGIPAVCAVDTTTIIKYLLALPNGVVEMSADIPGLVETSLNLGIVKLEENLLHTTLSVRSNIESGKTMMIHRLNAVAELAGASFEVSGSYPGWSYRKDSPLREKMIEVYEKMYGESPKVEALHAGLECGLLASKINDLDCISFGPNMFDIHTTEERLQISSTKRVWEYLVELLKQL